MADLSTLPQEVNVDHYAGDTLIIHIKIDPSVVAGRVYSAQVRSKANSTRIDAEFSVMITAVGADIMLASADCKRLAARGLYEGFWDVQLAKDPGPDPVTTLAYGEMRIHPDVTRPA